MACLHERIRRLETTPAVWCCESCDERFVPARTLVKLTQGLAAIFRGEDYEEDE